MKKRPGISIFLAAAIFLACSHANASMVATGVTVDFVPNAPSDFTATPDSPTQVTLSWTDNSNDTEDGFSIERKTGVAGAYAVIGTTGTGVATYTDNTASAGTTYFYRTRAFTGSLYSSYSNEASVTTPTLSTPPSPGGGGSGGGGTAFSETPTTNNNVTITGAAYPLSEVNILQNGTQVLQTIAGPDGLFSGSISDFPNGTYNFYVYATDSEGRRSTPFTFPVTVTTGATTNISGVFLSPTLSIDKQEVKQGDTIIIFGQTVPNVPVTIQVDSAVPVFVDTTSSADGVYTYDLDSGQLDLGSHLAKSEAQNGSLISDYSIAQSFMVGNEDIAAATTTVSIGLSQGDINGDGKVDLSDFSIMAYWYGQQNPPAIYLLDGGETIDLSDFSIMAYYWTG
jgi:hypothetical protein